MGLEWSDLNPFTWPGQVKKGLKKDLESLNGESEDTKQQRAALESQGKEADRFALRGEQDFGAMTREAAASRQYLRDLAQGKNSVSAEQLRQGMQQGINAQASMAAGASPQNSAMAARTAMNNQASLGYGMSGQQAVAGLQERNDAQRALAEMILSQRQQDVNVALGSRQNAISGYGGYKPEGSWWDKNGQTVQAAGSALAFLSDRRLKKDIKKGDGEARKVLRGLAAHSFKYKDERHGKGKQLGIMAQDLEKVGLKHAIIETPIGKAVDGGKVAASGLALVAALGRRVDKLEKGKR